MKTTKQKFKINKILHIILLSLAGVLIIGGISVYILIHSYVSKMNLIDTGTADSKTIETDAAYPELEAEMSNQDDSSVITGEDKEVADNTVDSLIKDVITPAINEQTLQDGAELDATIDENYEKVNALDEAIYKNLSDDTYIMDDKQVTNILFIGSDDSNILEREISDSIVVLSINQETEKIVATTLLKDIYLQIPGVGNNKLHVAYDTGGAELLLETVQLNFKIKIDRYIKMDLFSFISIIDTIGGITIEVEDQEIKKINTYISNINILLKEKRNNDFLTSSGTYLLNGKQALAYYRNQYTNEQTSSRKGKDQEIVQAIFDKVRKQNFLEMNSTLNSILPQITTNYSENEILALLLMMPTYMKYNIENWSLPMYYTYEKTEVYGSTVLGIDFHKNINELYKRVYNIK